MPNWTTNKVVLHEKDLRLLVNGSGEVDFNILRPMPKTLDIGSVSLETNRFAMDVFDGKVDSFPQRYPWLRTHLDYAKSGKPVHIERPTLDDYREFGRLLCQNVERYGHTDWYSWCPSDDGWSTKWNACEGKVGEPDGDGFVLVEFLSAWCCPQSIIRLLRKRATHQIRFECVDEDGYGDVHDEEYRDVEVSESLFRPEYYDEDGCQIAEDQYEQLRAAGKDVWSTLV